MARSPGELILPLAGQAQVPGLSGQGEELVGEPHARIELRGGQAGHRGACRALLPVEQVDEIVAVVPERCRHGGHPLPGSC
jgi:hypothetical protein